MAKQSNLIKLDEFNIQQLPELQNKKQEVAEKLNEFKYVEIVDNSTYEEAKKSRTGARTLRTTLQKEQKDVEKKIKDHILVPVKNAYDEIISSVLPIENKQQDEVSRWEEIKEQERQEKARLEQERVDGIKGCIYDFKAVYLETIDRLLYPGIDAFLPLLEENVSKMDRSKFEEFEILFDDAISEIKAKFKAKSDLLIANEELRLERERLAEIQVEQNRVNAIKTKIDSWEKNWLYVINNLEFRNISVTQNEFETQTALDCQELQSEYATKRNQIQELLSAKVLQLEEQENQRIERENFLKEKAEFEEKQLKARTESRIKQLTDLGFKLDDYEGADYCFGNKELNIFYSILHVTDYPEENWDSLISSVKNSIKILAKKEEQIKVDGYSTSEEEEISFVEHLLEQEDTPIIDSRVFGDQSKTHFQDLAKEIPIQEVDFEETWDSIFNDIENWNELVIPYCDIVKKYLVYNYNVPTKK